MKYPSFSKTCFQINYCFCCLNILTKWQKQNFLVTEYKKVLCQFKAFWWYHVFLQTSTVLTVNYPYNYMVLWCPQAWTSQKPWFLVSPAGRIRKHTNYNAIFMWGGFFNKNVLIAFLLTCSFNRRHTTLKWRLTVTKLAAGVIKLSSPF